MVFQNFFKKNLLLLLLALSSSLSAQKKDVVIPNFKKIELSGNQELLAQKLAKSQDYIARNEITEKLIVSAREDAYKNKNLQDKRKIIQYQAILNNKTLSPTKIKDSLIKLGLVIQLTPDANMIEFARLTRKINTDFPELNNLSKEYKRNVIARADQLILLNQNFSKN